MTLSISLFVMGAIIAISFGIMGILNASIEDRSKLPALVLTCVGVGLGFYAHVSIPGGFKLVHVVESTLVVLSRIL